ncbi:MAG TPA: hypothetical protein VF950_28545 [Planctomycetota bacterium]
MTKRFLCVAALLWSALPAPAYVEAPASLAVLLKESDVVIKGAVDAVSLEKKVVILRVGKAVKGKSAYEKIRVDLSTGDGWQPAAALRHAVAGTPVSIFYKKADNAETAAAGIVYLNRFFFMAQGGAEVWRFSKIELGMSKVFTGTPDELAELVAKVNAGRAKAPAAGDLKPWTKDALDALPLPPKEGEPWPPFSPGP